MNGAMKVNRGARGPGKFALILIAAIFACPGPARAEWGDLEIAFIRGLIARGPVWHDLAMTVAQNVEANRGFSEQVRGEACFFQASIIRLQAQALGDDAEKLQEYKEQVEICKKAYPKHGRTQGADFDLLRSDVETAKNLMGRALAMGDEEEIKKARDEAREIFKRAIDSFAAMIEKFDRVAKANPDAGDVRYKRDLAELIEADTLYAYATNVHDEGDAERKSLLGTALEKYNLIVEERFEFQNLLAYGYMGRGKCLYELGSLDDAALQFEELTAFSVGFRPEDPKFLADVQKLENAVRLEAFYMTIRTRLESDEVEGALQGVVEIFGNWLATVEGLRKSEITINDDPKTVRAWVRAYLPAAMAEEALKIAEDARARRKEGNPFPLEGRSIRKVRDPQVRHGIMALLEAARAISRAGDFDRAGKLLEALISDSRKRGPKMGDTDLDIFGYTAAKVCSYLIDDGAVSLPPGAAFWAGQGYFFSGKNDLALKAYRMAVSSGSRISEREYTGRALYEIATLLYAKKKAYLKAGIAFMALAEWYPDHREAARAARGAEEAFKKVEGNDNWIRKLRDRARGLVERSGQGVAPERHKFERANRLLQEGKFLEASEEFLHVREMVSTATGEQRVSFYLMARVKAGESLFKAYEEDPKAGAAHLEKAKEILQQALASAAEERDLRARAMGVYTLGGMVLASDSVAEFGAAAEVLSTLDKEPILEKEDYLKGWGYSAPARERQVHVLVGLGRLDEAEAAFGRLEVHLKSASPADEQGKIIRTAGFYAAQELAIALSDKGQADPAGGWHKRAGPYALWVADLMPPMKGERMFKLLGWAGSLVSVGGDWEGVVRINEKMLEEYRKSYRDKMLLKDGKTLVGEILEQDQKGAKIFVDGKMLYHEKIEIDRIITGIPKQIQQMADRARTDLGEAYLEMKKGEEAEELFKFLYDRPEYRGEYRVLEGYARAQFLRYKETKEQRYLTPKGAARDLFQLLWMKLKKAGEGGYDEKLRTPNDPPYLEKYWLVLEMILTCLYAEGDFDRTRYGDTVNHVDSLKRYEGLDKPDFPFPEIQKRILKLAQNAKKRQ